jgi:hypothetical protein
MMAKLAGAATPSEDRGEGAPLATININRMRQERQEKPAGEFESGRRGDGEGDASAKRRRVSTDGSAAAGEAGDANNNPVSASDRVAATAAGDVVVAAVASTSQPAVRVAKPPAAIQTHVDAHSRWSVDLPLPRKFEVLADVFIALQQAGPDMPSRAHGVPVHTGLLLSYVLVCSVPVHTRRIPPLWPDRASPSPLNRQPSQLLMSPAAYDHTTKSLKVSPLGARKDA